MEGQSPLTLPPGVWLTSVDSTMDEARRRLADGFFEGTGFVVADHQTQGRGTQGRPWVSEPERGLYLSVVHQAAPDSNGLPLTTLYTLSAGVACVEALKTYLGLSVTLKPVNDLMVEGQKLGGILTEADSRHGQLQWVITGVGLNWDQPQTPIKDAVHPPTALTDHLSAYTLETINREGLVEVLVAKLVFWHGLLLADQPRQVIRAWRRYADPRFDIPPDLASLLSRFS